VVVVENNFLEPVVFLAFRHNFEFLALFGTGGGDGGPGREVGWSVETERRERL
jgi:hypothetical protein